MGTHCRFLLIFDLYGHFDLVMSSQRCRPTTTGQSHNKRLNTYPSKRIVRELIS